MVRSRVGRRWGLSAFACASIVSFEVGAAPAPAAEGAGPVARPPAAPPALEIGNAAPAEELPHAPDPAETSAESSPDPGEGESPASTAPPAAQRPAKDDPVKVDGKGVDDIDDIEDVGLEGLLGMDLGDQMGTTEAASAKEEDALSAPATLSIMDADEIRLSGATNIPDLLRFIPGVEVVTAAPGLHFVSMRGTGGMTNNNIVVMVDGIPYTNVIDGSVEWDLLPVDVPDVERIEVVRGPVSPVYGANAYTGVINIVTRNALGLSPDWRVRGMGGLDLAASPFGGGSGSIVHETDTLRAKFFVSGAHDGLYRQFPDGDELHPANDRFSFFGSVDGSFAKHGFYSLQLGGAYGSRSGMDLLTRESQRYNREAGFGRFGIGVRGVDGAFDSFEFWVRDRGGHQATKADQGSGFAYGDSISNRLETGADLNFDLHETIELHGGVSGTWDYLADNEFLDPAVIGHHLGLGYRLGLRLTPTKKWIFGADIRGDRAPTMSKLQQSFRISGVYHRDNWALRAAVATAFRAPSYVEAGGEFTDPQTGFVLLEGSPDIAAPTARALEVGAILAPRSDLSLAPTLYATALKDTVVTDFDPLPRKSFRNDLDIRPHVGGEFEITWRKSDVLHLVGMVAGQYWLRVFDEDVRPTIGVPEQNSRFSGGVRAYGIFLNETMGYGVGARVAGPRSYVADAGIPLEVVRVEVPTTADLDAMIERRLHDKFPLWLSLRARSFLGPGVVEAPFNNGSPRGTSFLLGLEYRGR